MRVWALVVLSGCTSVSGTIRAVPAKSAPEAERIAAWEELRPDYRTDKLTLIGPQLRLRNGVVITEPSALLPALDPGSRAARLVQSYLRSSGVRDAAGPVAIVSGGASVAFAIFTFTGATRSESQVWFGLVGLAHAGFAVVNAALWAILAFVSGNERDLIFDEYEAALRTRLAIPHDVQ